MNVPKWRARSSRLQSSKASTFKGFNVQGGLRWFEVVSICL